MSIDVEVVVIGEENIELTGNETHAELEAIADEIIKPFDDVYTNKQLTRKAREMQSRLESRAIIEDYVCEDFTSIDDTFIESIMGDIKDAANRMSISDQDFDMIIMRAKKISYADIAFSVDLPVMTCYDRIQRARRKILQWEKFGYWEDVMNMERCLQSNWYPMFREMILWCAAGRPRFAKDKVERKKAVSKK